MKRPLSSCPNDSEPPPIEDLDLDGIDFEEPDGQDQWEDLQDSLADDFDDSIDCSCDFP